ncbi:MAG: hypothetical protein ACYDBK_01575 [Thermoplasmataceae archaeon]
MGIQGSLFAPSQQTSLSFTHSGFNATMSYSGGINYKFLENTVPSAISNEVVGTFPTIDGRMPSQSVLDPLNGMIYSTDFASNSITEMNPVTHALVGSYRAGLNPIGITFVQNTTSQSGYLYITNFFPFTNYAGNSYSTITVFDPTTFSIVKTINGNGLDTSLLYPSGITYIPYNGNFGYLYVATMNLTSSGAYIPAISVFNTSTNSMVFNETTKLSSGGLEDINMISFQNKTSNNMYNVWATDYWQNNVTNFTVNLLHSGPSNPPYETSPFSHNSKNITNPFGIAYNSINYDVYITDSPYLLTSTGQPHGKNINYRGERASGNVTIYKTTTGAGLLKQVHINMSEPSGIAISQNPANPNVYVSGYNVSYNGTGYFSYSPIVAINGSSNTVNTTGNINMNGTIKFLQGPGFISFYNSSNASSGQLILSDNLSDNTVFLSNLTGNVNVSYVWNNPFGAPGSMAIAYLNNDPTPYVAVVNGASNSVSMIDSLNNRVVARFGVGSEPSSVAYDQASGYLFVTNNLSNNVTVIDPNLGHSVYNISLQNNSDPSFGIYDASTVSSGPNGSVYVLDNGTQNITQIIQNGSLAAGTLNFTTHNFMVNPGAVYNHTISDVTSKTHKPGSRTFVYSNGSEEFSIKSNAYVNYTTVYVYGSGTLEFAIGTGNFTNSTWGDVLSPQTLTVTTHGKNGKGETIRFINTFIKANTSYYLSARWVSGNLTWGYTSIGVGQNYLQDYYRLNGQLVHDDQYPFLYKLGHTGSKNPPPEPFPAFAAINPSTNVMYVACYGSSSLHAFELSSGVLPTSIYAVGKQPDGVAFDSFDGSIYVSNSGSSSVSLIKPSSSTVSSFSVGSTAYPDAVIMDSGNGYVYIANNGSNNITLENTFTNSTINSIATGMGPEALAYNPENGYIYVADRGTNQITMINGGSIFFNGKSGHPLNGNDTGSGQIVSYGYTPFITPVAMHMQDGLILTNYSSTQYVTSSANVPISIVNNTGNIYLSSFLLNLQGSDSSFTGTGSNTMLINVANVSSTHRYDGQQFTYVDPLYHNPYPAMVTGIVIFNFKYVISSPYSSEIDQILFKEYNGSSNENLSYWNFTNFPFQVTLHGNNLSITNTQPLSVFSINFTYVTATVMKV